MQLKTTVTIKIQTQRTSLHAFHKNHSEIEHAFLQRLAKQNQEAKKRLTKHISHNKALLSETYLQNKYGKQIMRYHSSYASRSKHLEFAIASRNQNRQQQAKQREHHKQKSQNSETSPPRLAHNNEDHDAEVRSLLNYEQQHNRSPNDHCNNTITIMVVGRRSGGDKSGSPQKTPPNPKKRKKTSSSSPQKKPKAKDKKSTHDSPFDDSDQPIVSNPLQDRRVCPCPVTGRHLTFRQIAALCQKLQKHQSDHI